MTQPAPKPFLPPVPIPQVGKDGSLVWIHGHQCPHGHDIWRDDAPNCVEPMIAECPACFEWFEECASQMREKE